MSGIERAIAIASKVHQGQVDKAGNPYILHPLRVMLKFDSEKEQIVAVLHDTVEDGDITLDDLRLEGFKPEIIDAIDLLSRRPKETYEEFIARLSENRIACQVKVQDIRDNLDLTRLVSLDEHALRRIQKYHKAILLLMAKLRAVEEP